MVWYSRIPTPRISTDSREGAGEVFSWEYCDRMKFKVGDKVRLTREAISYKLREQHTIKYSIILWEKITDISEWDDMISVDYIWYKTEYLELVPEEPEFEYWEEIEVGDEDWRREKRIFLLKIPWNVIDPYVVVEWGNNERFQFGGSYDVEVWRYARKPRSSLTRKEIAEKFWVSEDFVLVD